MALIEVNDVSKEFWQSPKARGLRGAVRALFRPERKLVRAVDRVSFALERGEIVGYVGPNGAGKSTTLKMLCGILHPTSGEIRINGLSPQKDRSGVVRNLGAVFGQRTQLYWDLRLGESFELLKRIYQVPPDAYAQTLAWLTEALSLGELMDVPVRQLSLGQRMRGEMAAAMVHCPPILFLDEPTIGLDVNAKNAVREFILELNRSRQTTVILTTHDLVDVERLCRRLIVINHGRLIEDGPLDALIDRLAPYRILVIEADDPTAIVSHPEAELVRREHGRHWLRFDRKKTSASRLIADVSAQIAIRDLSVQEPNLEDVIRHVYGESKPHNADARTHG